MVTVHIFSLNAYGLGEEVKRVVVFTNLKQKDNGKGIFLLTESHTSHETISKWQQNWGNKNILFSHGAKIVRLLLYYSIMVLN